MINQFKYLAILFLLSTSFLISNCTTSVKMVSNSSEIVLVPSNHILTPIRLQPGENPLEYKSYLYEIKKDTFRLTILDRNRNGKFNDPLDLVVVSTSQLSVPIVTIINPNVSNYFPGMFIVFKDYYFEINSITEEGDKVMLKRIFNTNRTNSKPAARYTDFINKDLQLESVFGGELSSIGDIISEHNQKSVYFHFWWTSCPPCFSEIPIIQKLIQKDVLVINIANKKLDSSDELIKVIEEYEYPGYHYYGNPDVIREFSQNGFPFGTLIESKSFRKLIEGKNAFDIYEEAIGNLFIIKKN